MESQAMRAGAAAHRRDRGNGRAFFHAAESGADAKIGRRSSASGACTVHRTYKVCSKHEAAETSCANYNGDDFGVPQCARPRPPLEEFHLNP
eukprot:2690888-Pleurochrysis_carterae.AAC.2